MFSQKSSYLYTFRQHIFGVQGKCKAINNFVSARSTNKRVKTQRKTRLQYHVVQQEFLQMLY